MKYVRTFELRDEGNRTEYYLVFATHSIDGLEAMKGAMWKIDPSGGFSFSDFTADQPTMFDEHPDFGPLQTAVNERFHGSTVKITEVETFVITDTPFLHSHLRSNVLVDLQNKGKLVVKQYGDGKTTFRNHRFPKGTLIEFMP